MPIKEPYRTVGEDIVHSVPPKMHLQDLISLERIDVQFNPASIDDAIEVNWTKQVVPGLSHRKYQYNYTDNLKISLELVFDSFFDKDLTPLETASKFLQSLCYKKKAGEMSRVLAVWPGFFSMVCVIDGSLKTKTTRFNSNAQRTLVTITVPLTEIRDTILTSEGVRQNGLIRTTALPTIPDGNVTTAGNLTGNIA